MPSGKKKRKAIRKKKEQEAQYVDENNHHHHVSGSHGDKNEDLRSQDEKDGDNGDVGSPASHGHHLTFNGESEEPAKNETFSVGTSADGNKSVEVPKVSQEESSSGNGDDDKLEGPMSKDDSCIAIDSVKEIPPESQVYVKELEDEESNEVLGMETTQVESFVQITDPLPQAVTEVTDSTKSIAQNSEDMSLIMTLASAATDTAQVKNATDSKMILESEGTTVNVVSPTSVFYSGSTKFRAKVYPISTDSSVLAPASNKQEPELLQYSEPVICQAYDGLTSAEDTYLTEYSEKQPLVAPAPRAAERTSWMNCCGILDLFSGSSR